MNDEPQVPPQKQLQARNAEPLLPEQEQLHALAMGRREVFRLLESHVGDLDKAGDFRRFITVREGQLKEYLERNPDLAKQHISSPSTPRYHEFPVLEQTEHGYRVYEVDHGNARNVQEFNDLPDAAATFLLWNMTVV